ncbi:MAG: putative molybdenum carrier protein [Desulfobacula sp.]|nr:putative molybdenum carrier protein [Desulfobacula sp.]MDA8134796.1 putative molybdenum carrier protein [Desulfobacteraceae bacterium]
MLKKIVSGGQTGADRAALDIALKFNMNHGGWIPKGRRAEDGPLKEKYRLTETGSEDYRERTKLNVIDSHGTVILSRGELTGGSKFTRTFAKLMGRPNCYVDLSQSEEFEAAVILKSFILENQILVLNVAGPRQSTMPGIYADVKTILEVLLYLLFLDTRKDRETRAYIPSEPFREAFPQDLNACMDLLYQDIPLKTRTFMARLEPTDISVLYFTFLDYIRHRVGFDTENKSLLQDCADFESMDDTDFTIEDAVMVILKKFKRELEKDHILRVIQ